MEARITSLLLINSSHGNNCRSPASVQDIVTVYLFVCASRDDFVCMHVAGISVTRMGANRGLKRKKKDDE